MYRIWSTACQPPTLQISWHCRPPLVPGIKTTKFCTFQFENCFTLIFSKKMNYFTFHRRKIAHFEKQSSHTCLTKMLNAIFPGWIPLPDVAAGLGASSSAPPQVWKLFWKTRTICLDAFCFDILNFRVTSYYEIFKFQNSIVLMLSRWRKTETYGHDPCTSHGCSKIS